MKQIDFASAPSRLREQAWQIYETSFPEYERRSRMDHDKALKKDPRFNSTIYTDDEGSFMALLFYWRYDDVSYVEHIAVNPLLRGQNIGSVILNRLLEESQGRTVILEIDPPEDEISVRRLHFYERLGFVANDYDFMHPSYSRGDKARPHRLIVLSHGKTIDEDRFRMFNDFLGEICVPEE